MDIYQNFNHSKQLKFTPICRSMGNLLTFGLHFTAGNCMRKRSCPKILLSLSQLIFFSLDSYEGCLQSNLRLLAMGLRVGVTSPLLYRQTYKVSQRWTVALARFCERFWILVAWKNYCCKNKTKLAKCEMHAVLQFLTAKN